MQCARPKGHNIGFPPTPYFESRTFPKIPGGILTKTGRLQRGESRTFETMAENQLQQQLSADWTCTRRRVGIRKGARGVEESAIRE